MKPLHSAGDERKKKATGAELAAGAFFLVAALVLAGTLVRQRLERRPASVSRTKVTTMIPAPEQEGVLVIPGPGRLLYVDSTPDGAELLLDGTRRGQTPFTTDFVCQEGMRTVVELKKPGYRLARFELDCVGGATRISATLKKGR